MNLKIYSFITSDNGLYQEYPYKCPQRSEPAYVIGLTYPK